MTDTTSREHDDGPTFSDGDADATRASARTPVQATDDVAAEDHPHHASADTRGASDDEPATAPFPVTSGRAKGYDRDAVNAFLEHARVAYEDGTLDPGFTSAAVREWSFPLTRRGYAVGAVDAALGRIEDAFAARERSDGIASAGVDAWVAAARGNAQEILDRLRRRPRHKFRRTGMMRFGYRVDEVDMVADKLAGYFESGEAVSVEQVRQIAFRMQRRGYEESQVDAVLDAVVDVMLAVR